MSYPRGIVGHNHTRWTLGILAVVIVLVIITVSTAVNDVLERRAKLLVPKHQDCGTCVRKSESPGHPPGLFI